MKKFERDGKINFVDANNAFVGYDTEQCCCEDAGWFFASEPRDQIGLERDPSDDELAPLVFDPEFFEERTHDSLDAGAIAIFKLVGDGGPLYLHIYNSHNGYYGHGFESVIGGIDRDGCL